MKLRASHTIYSDCMRVVRNSVFLIPYIPFACVLHETQCSSYHTALYISFRLYARRTKFSVLYHIFRLYACCMKLRASHTIYSDCMRVVRNSVFLILYIPTACASYETPCFSYYIFRLYARRTKLSASHTIYSDCMRIVRNSVSYTIYSDCMRVA